MNKNETDKKFVELNEKIKCLAVLLDSCDATDNFIQQISEARGFPIVTVREREDQKEYVFDNNKKLVITF